eukprot:144478-Rhodomonas_salina.2
MGGGRRARREVGHVTSSLPQMCSRTAWSAVQQADCAGAHLDGKVEHKLRAPYAMSVPDIAQHPRRPIAPYAMSAPYIT